MGLQPACSCYFSGKLMSTPQRSSTLLPAPQYLWLHAHINLNVLLNVLLALLALCIARPLHSSSVILFVVWHPTLVECFGEHTTWRPHAHQPETFQPFQQIHPSNVQLLDVLIFRPLSPSSRPNCLFIKNSGECSAEAPFQIGRLGQI